MNPIIIALDFESARDALQLVKTVGTAADFYKIGMELYAAAGMELVRELHEQGKKVFLDLKLYDIGETVRRATRQIASTRAVEFLTVHGSKAIMSAAAEGKAQSQIKLLAVTVLTSFDQRDLAELGFEVPLSELVDLRARNANETGMNGIVCSPLEISRVRTAVGTRLTVVVPGVRSPGASTGDQKRVATPAQAMLDGADYLVIGRQIIRAQEPREACSQIRAEIEEAMRNAPAALRI